MFLALSMPQNVHFSDRNLYECDTSSGSILNCVFNWARRNNMGLYNTCQYIYLHVQEERFSMNALAVTSWISSYRGCNVCVAVPPFNNYVHLVLAVCLTRDLFWARFGCDPREDFGGGEVGRTCRHDWRIFISTPETKFHRKFKIWQELVNQMRKQLEINMADKQLDAFISEVVGKFQATANFRFQLKERQVT